MKKHLALLPSFVACSFLIIAFLLVSCGNTNQKQILTFQSGCYYRQSDNVCLLFLAYDLTADDKQNLKMPNNGNMRENVSLDFNGETYYDASLAPTYVKTWTSAFGSSRDYIQGCNCDIQLIAGTKEVIKCGSLFAIYGFDTTSDIVLTSHLLPEEQTITIPASSLIEIDKPSDMRSHL